MKILSGRRAVMAGGVAGALALVLGAASQAPAATQTYPIAPGYTVNVRSGPSTAYSIVRVLSEGSRVPIYCQTPGQSVSGPYGTSNIWDNIASGQYVSDAYVNTGSDGYIAARCS